MFRKMTPTTGIWLAATALAASLASSCATGESSPRASGDPVTSQVPPQTVPWGSRHDTPSLPRVLTPDLLDFITPHALKVQDLDGADVSIGIGPRTLVVALATWCPISKQFVAFVKDRRMRSMLAGYTLAFVLTDEWSTIEDKLKEQDPSLAASPALLARRLESMKEDAGNGPFFDPTFLDELPGKYYVHRSPDTIGIVSFPTLYDARKGAFDEHPTLWIGEHLTEKAGMSTTTFVRIWESHES